MRVELQLTQSNTFKTMFHWQKELLIFGCKTLGWKTLLTLDINQRAIILHGSLKITPAYLEQLRMGGNLQLILVDLSSTQLHHSQLLFRWENYIFFFVKSQKIKTKQNTFESNDNFHIIAKKTGYVHRDPKQSC